MSKALYQKYRPGKFSEFVGQEHVVKTVTNAIKDGSFSHAYIFSGPRGTGKTTMARLLAKTLNCTDRKKFEPCSKCAACVEVESGRSMDIVEIDAASHTGVDAMREVISGIRFNPSSLKHKVLIIDECHQLSKSASNALLKTLEEPPAHAVIILATTEPQKILPTIISRSQSFTFKLLQISEIVGKLKRIVKEEGLEADEAALYSVARAARGSIRDSESLLDQVISFVGGDKKIESEEVKDVLGLIGTEMLSEFTQLLLEKKQKEAIEYIHRIQSSGLDIKEFTDSLVNYLRQVLVLSMGGDESLVLSSLTEEEAKELKEMVKDTEHTRASLILENVLDALNKMKYSSIVQLPLELAVVEVCK